MTVLFSDGFESGDYRGWSFVQAHDKSQGPGGPGNRVGTASSLGVKPHGGSYAAQFERPASATSRPHAKVFKEWSNTGKWDEFGRRMGPLPNGGNPSGTYRAWFQFPADYKASSSGWMNLFQFKEQGSKNGKWHQDPSWWLNVSSASKWGQGGSEPVVFANHWNNKWDYTPKTMKLPVGRWFEVRAELYEKDRIEWYVDGKLLDVSKHSTYPVGRFFDKSDGWVFGVGHYQGVGRVLVDDASMSTRSGGSASAPPPPGDTAAPEPVASPTPPGGTGGTDGKDTITLWVAGDQYQGAPHFDLLVDGKQIADGAATVSRADGGWQKLTFEADLDGARTLGVRFDNDLWGGGSSRDRNLWIDKVAVNGTVFQAEDGLLNGQNRLGKEALYFNSTLGFDLGKVAGLSA